MDSKVTNSIRTTTGRAIGLALIAILAAAPAFAANVMVSGNITVSETWTADNTYILTEVIYVTNGATLTIEPGTVIRGETESSPGANDPGALVITRGSKIQAFGNADEPIIFTDLLDDNIGDSTGTPPYDTQLNALGLTGQWGGVIILGQTYVANNTLTGPDATRENQIEGLTAVGGLGFYGNGGNDDDDSGQMSYVSIRYGGFNLAADNEINGLTLGAVGRETNLHHIEVFQNKDDGVEFFGGTVGIQNLIVANVGDDSIDWDEGFRGKGQFLLVLQGTPGADKSDKGAEQDGGNSPDGSQPYAMPEFYNATFVGLGQKGFTDGIKNTALHFRDNTGGHWYNSAFLDFGGATVCIEGDPSDLDSSGARAATAMAGGTCDNGADPPTFCNSDADCGGGSCEMFFQDNGATFQLELEDNDFWCFGNADTIPTDAGSATTVGCDSKDHYDPGVFTNPALDNSYAACGEERPIRQLDRLASPFATVPDPIDTIDPRPTPGGSLLTTDRSVPLDGFFKPAGYKGAFGDTNWADGWSILSRLGYFPGGGENVLVTSNISESTTWSKGNTYTLTEVIYVTDGATLTIEPGAVIRSEPESSPGANDPGTLVITRGSKIQANGTAEHPIVFTDLNDDNVGGNLSPTPPYDSRLNAIGLTGQWGGVIILGETYVANNTLAGPDASRENQIEGLTAEGGVGFYGNGGNDDDDSGSMSYVSIRYGGFNLAADNEINGLTLGAVGRGTDLHHIEVFQNKDDGVEFFGGTVGIKNLIVANVGDDSIDWDEGFRGKGQHILVLQGTPGSDKSDKGAEQDGGNSPDGSQPYAMPEFYNATFVGLGQKGFTDGIKNTALHFRDNTGGHWYNSAFLDFGGATVCIEGDPSDLDSSGARAATAMAGGTCDNGADPPTFCNSDADCGGGSCEMFFQDNGATFQLELEDNDFWCFGNADAIPTDAGSATTVGCDSKDHYDPGVFTNAALDNSYAACGAANPIRQLDRTSIGFPTIPDPINAIDPRPAPGSSLLTTDRSAPNDGFFTAANYKGAFDETNWARGWSTLDLLGYFPDQVETISSNITTSRTLNADTEYTLSDVIYVTDGATLTIEPGTVIRSEPESSPGANDPGTLVITRGSKIQADGTAALPIVFTDLNDDNVGGNPAPTPPYDTAFNALGLTGQWGGVIILGETYVANNTLTGPDASRENQIEGLTAEGGVGFYGNGGNDDDDSGSMSYVSIRYGGFNLAADNEINGLTLGAVGRGTDLHHIEVFQNKDDGVEFFGGTVGIKNLIVANVGDDSIDWDEGFRGRGQHILVLQGTPGSDKSDKGAEQDGGNSPDGSQPYAMPEFYNATFVGLGQKGFTDGIKNTALHFRDNTGGHWYNSAFLDFGGATVCIEGDPSDLDSSGARAATAMAGGTCDNGGDPPTFCNSDADCGGGSCEMFFQDNGATFQLELEDNDFWCFGNADAIPTDAGSATTVGCDSKDHYDPGVFTNAALDNSYAACGAANPIRQLDRTSIGFPTIPDPINAIDPRPAPGSSLLTTDRSAPADGFFTAAGYKGAFSPTENWARGWSTLDAMGYFPTCNGGNGVIPEGATQLSWAVGTTILGWEASVEEGVVYDVLRKRGSTSAEAASFGSADCVEADDGSDTIAIDKDVPGSDSLFFYLVRTQNECGGNLGSRSDGAVRTGPQCF